MSENLDLWNKVRTPDPKFTKAFSRGGGFKGSATNVVYMIRVATEMWGPMGGNWGVEIKDEQYVNGAPLLHEGAAFCTEIIHVIRIELRHPGGVIPGIGQTVFVGKNKNGFFTDEEAPKKSLTDALSKAMSWLGFAADIHMGMWDDNKYVNDVRRRFEQAEEEERAETITTAQVAEINALLKATGADQPMLLEWIASKSGTEIKTVADIPAAAFDAVIRALSKKREGATA